jgi:hypothetical protein
MSLLECINYWHLAYHGWGWLATCWRGAAVHFLLFLHEFVKNLLIKKGPLNRFFSSFVVLKSGKNEVFCVLLLAT